MFLEPSTNKVTCSYRTLKTMLTITVNSEMHSHIYNWARRNNSLQIHQPESDLLTVTNLEHPTHSYGPRRQPQTRRNDRRNPNHAQQGKYLREFPALSRVIEKGKVKKTSPSPAVSLCY